MDVLTCQRQSFRQVWYKSLVHCMRNANKCPKIPLFLNGEANEKLIWNPHADPDHHQKLITSRGSPLPMPAKFGRHLFQHSSVIQFTVWQNDRLDSNLDFWIDPHSNICQICPKMFWMHYLVGSSHFTKYRTNRPLIVSKMLTNVYKSPIPQ